ncbi:DinB family protein [Paeniglutamicibacter gangotriensis]|nr:DinB family protein [Paeniglutamicibacter gangotriensis]KAA0978994.1 DinB family protein [Paeniglutamicibacter gangotriensis]
MEELKKHLMTYLDNAREAVLWKAEGLSDSNVSRPMVGSGTNILGVIQHLATVEYGYFVECLGHTVTDERHLTLMADEEAGADMWVPAEIPRTEIIDFYRRAIETANKNIAALDTDVPATVPWWKPETRKTTLGRLLLHMNVETSRHSGHIDIIRELIDGSTGLYRDNTNIPAYEPAAWAALQEKIRNASHSR